MDFLLNPTLSSFYPQHALQLAFVKITDYLSLAKSKASMSSYLTESAWKVDHFLLCATPFFLVSWISRFSASMTLPQWGTLASMGTLFQTFRWILSHHQNGECRKTSVLRLLFQHFTLMISSSLLALNTTSCCQLPNLHHMLRPVYWTSGLKQSTQHFTCMSHNSKHSKFITNFRSSPAKLFLHMSVNGNSILAVVEAQTLSHFWVLYFSHIPPMIF